MFLRSFLSKKSSTTQTRQNSDKETTTSDFTNAFDEPFEMSSPPPVTLKHDEHHRLRYTKATITASMITAINSGRNIVR